MPKIKNPKPLKITEGLLLDSTDGISSGLHYCARFQGRDVRWSYTRGGSSGAPVLKAHQIEGIEAHAYIEPTPIGDRQVRCLLIPLARRLNKTQRAKREAIMADLTTRLDQLVF